MVDYNPKTGARYEFPGDLGKYVAAYKRTKDPQPCERGHAHCAAWDGGPCVEEIDAMRGDSASLHE